VVDPAEYPLLRSQTALLAKAYLLTQREGYRWWKYQTAPEEKILGALAKLHERHHVLLDRNTRSYRRRMGLPVAQVLLAPEPRGGEWPMLLLATKKLEGENLFDVRKKPLTWVAYSKEAGGWTPFYVLEARGGHPTPTWWLHHDVYQRFLEEALFHAQRRDWPRLAGLLRALGEYPAFRGIWTQIREIERRARQIWSGRIVREAQGRNPLPPWRSATRDWRKTPLSPMGVELYRNEPPRTLGEWLAIRP
jgi:hypothetical protein